MRPKTSGGWGVYLAPAAPEIKTDLGIAVAKKFARRAVDRNRLKRMIRQHVRCVQADGILGEVVVKLKKPIGKETHGKLRKKEKTLLREQIIGLI
jgi:ribonuclease P protein component|uniref:ribonuclease P protein component n=1 Tax=Polynucleobacter sp. TaxID=2029855 RepID=UPI00404853BD